MSPTRAAAVQRGILGFITGLESLTRNSKGVMATVPIIKRNILNAYGPIVVAPKLCATKPPPQITAASSINSLDRILPPNDLTQENSPP